MRALSPDDEASIQLIAQLASHLSSNVRSAENIADHTRGESVTFEEHDRNLQLAAKVEYEARGRRASFFNEAFFGEPAWDILLDLYFHQTQPRKTSVTSACIAARVPSTTALRWIGQLQDAGLISRQRDAEDSRRWFLQLTAKGLLKMEAYLMNRAELLQIVSKA